jgi:hypothetical protein
VVKEERGLLGKEENPKSEIRKKRIGRLDCGKKRHILEKELEFGLRDWLSLRKGSDGSAHTSVRILLECLAAEDAVGCFCVDGIAHSK